MSHRRKPIAGKHTRNEMCKAVHVIVACVCMYVQATQNDVDKQIAHPQNILCYARGRTKYALRRHNDCANGTI